MYLSTELAHWKNELRAGFVTFLTLCYIIFVNPAILKMSGMPYDAVFTATCLVGVLGCLLVGFLSDLPVAIAPAMGTNIYFSYILIGTQGFTWEQGLGAVFLSGVMFVVLTLTRLRQYFIDSIPKDLAYATANGIALFIALVALESSGIVIAQKNTLLTLSSLAHWPQFLCLAGLLLIVVLNHLRIHSALVITILLLSILGCLLGYSHFTGVISMPPSVTPLLMHLKFNMTYQGLMVSLTFLLITLFDSTGTLLGLTELLPKVHNHNQKIGRALLAESISTSAAALIGTSTTCVYIESAAGISAGGKSGLTAIFVALFFALALFFSPLTQLIPTFATAPALLFVSCLLFKHIKNIQWDDVTIGVPAILTIIMIPLSFSITKGIALGFISYTLIQLLTKQWHRINGVLLFFTVVFIFYFAAVP